MLLRPRKFFFKNKQKKRSLPKPKYGKLLYGQFGLKTLQPLRLNNKQIFRYKIFLKKSVRRADKTNRRLWVNVFPHLPLTRKVSGSRMGKGKGKLSNWVANINSGVNIFELRNLRTGRAVYFLKQITYRLPTRTEIITRYESKVSLIFMKNITITEEFFW